MIIFDYLFPFGESGLVVNIRGDEGELMSVRQHAQQQNYSATATLPHPVIHNLTRERYSLQQRTLLPHTKRFY